MLYQILKELIKVLIKTKMDGSRGIALMAGMSPRMHMYLHEHVSLHPGRRFFKFPLVSQSLPQYRSALYVLSWHVP